jgi:hypothetical protein
MEEDYDFVTTKLHVSVALIKLCITACMPMLRNFACSGVDVLTYFLRVLQGEIVCLWECSKFDVSTLLFLNVPHFQIYYLNDC